MDKRSGQIRFDVKQMRFQLICLCLIVLIITLALWQGLPICLQTEGNIESTTSESDRKADSTSRPLLVDITELDLIGWTAKYSVCSSEGRLLSNQKGREQLGNQNHSTSHKILWYNRPGWLPCDQLNFHTKACPINNCQHTDDKRFLKNSSALIFSITQPGLGVSPPLKPSERPSRQAWLYYGVESPATQNRYFKRFIPSWENSLNWSMSYRLDSDIVTPYGYLQTRQFITQHNYSDIFRRKTKWAAWLVSKCHVSSLRDKFVDKLRKYGLPVDIYGRCGEKLKTDPEELISNNHKFYLGFENSMCLDYVTEKFFKYFNYDTIVVVRGGADYKKLLPENTFIDTASFRSFKELVGYLKKLGNNETLYTDFLKRKDKYKAIRRTEDKLWLCALCAKLNQPFTYRKTYERIPRNLDACYTPEDIHFLDTV